MVISAYAKQAASGFALLCFENKLEQQYQAHAAARRRVWIRWAQLAVLLLIVAVIGSIPATQISGVLLTAAPSVSLSIALFMFASLQSAKRTLDILGVGLFATLLIISCNALTLGAPPGIAVVSLAAAWLLLGLDFRLAATSVAIGLPVVTMTLWQSGLAAHTAGLASLLVIVLSGLFGVAAYCIDYLRRDNFLKSREIAYQRTRDLSTGLPNRQALNSYLRRIWKHCSRESIPIAIANLKIDHFAEYIDKYGLDAAEKCVHTLAALVQDASRRPLDFVARLDGDEFVIVLPGCNTHRATAVAEYVRRETIAQVIEHLASPSSALLTVSAGVTSCAPRSEVYAKTDILHRARQALVDARKHGYNRVVATDPPPPDGTSSNVIRLSDARYTFNQKAR